MTKIDKTLLKTIMMIICILCYDCYDDVCGGIKLKFCHLLQLDLFLVPESPLSVAVPGELAANDMKATDLLYNSKIIHFNYKQNVVNIGHSCSC